MLCLGILVAFKQDNDTAYIKAVSSCQRNTEPRGTESHWHSFGVLDLSLVKTRLAFCLKENKPWQKTLVLEAQSCSSVSKHFPSVLWDDCILNGNSDMVVSGKSRCETKLSRCSSWQGIKSKIIKRKQTGLVVWTRNFNFRSTIELGQHPVHNVYR